MSSPFLRETVYEEIMVVFCGNSNEACFYIVCSVCRDLLPKPSDIMYSVTN